MVIRKNHNNNNIIIIIVLTLDSGPVRIAGFVHCRIYLVLRYDNNVIYIYVSIDSFSYNYHVYIYTHEV